MPDQNHHTQPIAKFGLVNIILSDLYPKNFSLGLKTTADAFVYNPHLWPIPKPLNCIYCVLKTTYKSTY